MQPSSKYFPSSTKVLPAFHCLWHRTELVIPPRRTETLADKHLPISGFSGHLCFHICLVYFCLIGRSSISCWILLPSPCLNFGASLELHPGTPSLWGSRWSPPGPMLQTPFVCWYFSCLHLYSWLGAQRTHLSRCFTNTSTLKVTENSMPIRSYGFAHPLPLLNLHKWHHCLTQLRGSNLGLLSDSSHYLTFHIQSITEPFQV